MKVRGRIAQLHPLNSSASGNPRWCVLLEDGTVWRTQPDASCAYGLSNPEFRNVDVEFVMERGQIAYATPVKQAAKCAAEVRS